jgi:FMN phosphatase YigB (HAD superfamily)
MVKHFGAQSVVVCDLDGTLCDTTHRNHFLLQDPKPWDQFYLACIDDVPINPIIQTLWALRDQDFVVVLMSGRGSVARERTIFWLDQHDIPYDHLYMRGEGDHRPDHVLKREWALELGPDAILTVFEDRKAVVEMWRELGVHCCQVAHGDF